MYNYVHPSSNKPQSLYIPLCLLSISSSFFLCTLSVDPSHPPSPLPPPPSLPPSLTPQDDDPYVRKTAAVCVAKLYDINAQLVEDQGFLDLLKDLLSDSTPMVVANAIAALAEISQVSPTGEEGGCWLRCVNCTVYSRSFLRLSSSTLPPSVLLSLPLSVFSSLL